MVSRQALHSMLDDVPEHLLAIAEVSLLRLGNLAADPFWRQLAEAGKAEEPLDSRDVAVIEMGWESLAGGRGIPDETLDSLLG